MRKLLVVLIVLAALGVGGDRVAARLVADEAERRLVEEGFARPAVQLHGFPFLTQLAAREFDQVTVTGDLIEAADGTARDVNAELTDVDAPASGAVRIASLTATGTVPFDEVSAAVGSPSLRLSPGPDGQVEVNRTVELAGQSFDVVALARVQARGGRLRIVPTDLGIAGGGSLDVSLVDLLTEQVAFSYVIPDLPDGVRVEEVTAGVNGFVVRVSGRDVSVDQG